jgi:hypothetical protein
MKLNEFAEVITWLSVAIGRPIADDATQHEARMDVYFEMLGDLPLAAFKVAARRCAAERKYQSFPSIAELREMALETTKGTTKELTGAEAFGIALKACNNTDVDVDGSRERAFAKVPPNVKAALDVFGFRAMYNLPSGAIETARAQFTKIFEAIQEREKKTQILPAAVQKQIKEIGQAPPALEAARARIIAYSPEVA